MAIVTDPANPHRNLFEGTQEEAEEFIRVNAPRSHSDNGHPVPGLVIKDSETGEE
jgi:hypothetical protein